MPITKCVLLGDRFPNEKRIK